MTIRRNVAVLATLAALGAAALAQDPAPGARPAPEANGQEDRRGGFPDLVKGLKETPGCLGVETAQTSGRKQVIFAWFKDKASALAWYGSDMHRGLMRGMGAGEGRGLREVPDDGKPIMVVASITPSEKPEIEGFPMPISQVSIELYQPLPGGASIGGTFAPRALDIPKMKRHNEEASPARGEGPAGPK